MSRRLCAVVKVRKRVPDQEGLFEGKEPKGKAFGRTERKRSSANQIAAISGGNGEGVPPVPIPNTEVKPFSADGTWLDTARESRSPPDSIEDSHARIFFFYCIEKPLTK